MSHRIGQTPLFAAVMEGHVECVRLLLDAGANPAKKNLRGAIPNIIALHRRVLLHVINLVCLVGDRIQQDLKREDRPEFLSAMFT